MGKFKTRSKKRERRKAREMSAKDIWFVTFSGDRDSDEDAQICITNAKTTKMRNQAMALRDGWCIMMAFICETEDEYYAKQDYIIRENCAIRELDDVFKAKREALHDTCNEAHIIDFGWVIRPYTKGRADSVMAGEYKPVIDYWLERKASLDMRATRSLEAMNKIQALASEEAP